MINLKLDKITRTKLGTELIDLLLTIEYPSVDESIKETLTANIRGGGHKIRIMSDHLIREMKVIIECIDNNYKIIQEFAKEISNANKKLKEVVNIGVVQI